MRPSLSMARLFGQTLRAAPTDAEVEGHRLLLRAGFIRQLASGIFTALPLGWRSMRRIEAIIRQEMDAIGGQEMLMPLVNPAEVWQRTGRWYAVGEEMVRFQDRAAREMVLAMTHEEVVTDLAAREILSWRQLPQIVYHIQTKFRDEPRPRAGLIRVREFVMKDSYSFDRDAVGLQNAYDAHRAAYERIYRRCGLDSVVAVQSDTGMMGGRLAHEFMYPSDVGEDTIVRCGSCGVAENQQVARFAKPVADNGAPRPLERVATAGMATIAALAGYLHVSPADTAKAVFFTATVGGDRDIAPADSVVFAMVRGDHEVNETKLANTVRARHLRPASAEEIRAVGATPGYASPVGIAGDGVVVVVDDCLWDSTNLVSGANEAGVHFLNVNPKRDFAAGAPPIITDIATATTGATCVRCAGTLETFRAIEVGNIFQLGTRYSEALGAMYTDERGEQLPLQMGSYGIGVGRLLACVAEAYHDAAGLRLPPTVAPVDAHVVALGGDGTAETLDDVVRNLEHADVDALVDDRPVSAGVKYADADLIGAPVRLTVSRRSVEAGGVELRHRSGGHVEMVPTDGVVAAVHEVSRAQ